MANHKQTLENLAALGVCSALFLWGGSIPNPMIGTTLSLGSGVALNQYCKKRKVALRPLLGEAIEATTPLLTTTATTLKAEAEEAPPIIKWGFEFMAKAMGKRTDDDFHWFREMEYGLGESHLMPYGNWLICGEQREGKTHATKWMFNRYLEQHPGCKVLWADLEAQTHPEGYHMGVPVADTVPKILGVFREIESYLNRAKGDGSDLGLVVLWDEAKATLNQLNDQQREYVTSVLQDVHSRGAKRKCTVLSIFHTLAGGVLKWKGIMDFCTKANLLLLPYFAQDDQNFRLLQWSASLEDARAKLLLEELPPLASPEPKPVLLYRNKSWSMRWVPTIPTVNTVVTDEPEPPTPDADPYGLIREWLAGIELPEEELSLNRLLKCCDASSSKHKAVGTPLNDQWKAYLEAHNTRVLNPFNPAELEDLNHLNH